MAGSLRTFVYTLDNGSTFLYTADESNNEAVNLALANATPAQIAVGLGIPRNIRPRIARYSNATRTRTLSIIVHTLARFGTLPVTIPDPIDAGTLALTGVTAERRRIYPASDTALTDGDAPN